MNTVVYHKFTQHRDLRRELLGTGDAELIEVRASRRSEIRPGGLTNLRIELGQRCVLGLWGGW